MKKQLLFTVLAIASLFTLGSCSDDDHNTKFEPLSSRRNIEVDLSSVSASETMSAYIKLPNNISKYIQEGDEFVALANQNNDYMTDPSRGKGEIVKDGDGNLIFSMMIYGTSSEQTNLYFVYYSSKNKYQYKSDAFLKFTPDSVLGTTDEPYEVSLKIVNK